MFTFLISISLAILSGFGVKYLSGSTIFAVLVSLVTVIMVNLLVGRHFLKKHTALMKRVEKDMKQERFDAAIETLKSAYQYANWQFMLKQNVDSHIGTLYYARRKFDEALPYLKNAMVKNYIAICMLASYYYRNKDYVNAFASMDKAIKANKKEPFVYSLYAYMLAEQKNVDKAIAVLTKGVAKLPLDKQLQNELEALKNKRKLKIQNYGHIWLQMHLGKTVDAGVRPYQAMIANQRIRRR